MSSPRVLLLALSVVACTELPPIAPGVCGNRVVEPEVGEDCDTFSREEGTSCVPAGQQGQCRYSCASAGDGGTAACPVGMACGTDGLCRQPSGRFTALAAFPNGGAEELVAGDFDGAGGDDLAVSTPSGIEMIYLDAAGGPDETVTLATDTPPSALSARDLSGDGRDDLLLAGSDGILLALGGADRTPRFLVHPIFTFTTEATDFLFGVGNVVSETPGDDVLAFATGATGTDAAIVLAGDAGIRLIQLLRQGVVADLAGEPVLEQLDERASSPCDEIVLAYRDSPEVDTLSPCTAGPSGEAILALLPPTSTVRLPGGAVASGGVTARDVNADGHIDLVIPARTAGNPLIAVAYGVGDGTFHSDPATLPASAGDQLFRVHATLTGEPPVAIGHLDGDGILDYVAGDAVWVSALGSASGARYDRAALNATYPAAPWSRAVIADLNIDGLADVAALRPHAPGLSLHVGTGGGYLASQEMPTSGTVEAFVSGDLDGDRIVDLAIAERLPESDPLSVLGDAVSILYGRPAGIPERPVTAGYFGQVIQLLSARSVSNGVVDGIDDILVNAVLDGVPATGGFPGRASRVARIPFGLPYTTPAGGPGFASALRIAVGAFAASGTAGVAALGETASGEHHIWSIATHDDGRLDPSGVTLGDLLPADLGWRSSLLTAVDLDGDGTQELVGVAPKASAAGRSGLVIGRTTRGDAGAERFELGAVTDLELSVDPGASTRGDVTGRIGTGDVDGDGSPDVVLHAYDGTAGRVYVLRSNGAGGLEPPVAASGPLDAVSFALLQATPSATLEIAVLATDGTVHLVERDGGAWETRPGSLASLPGATLVTPGDFDGDGVQDLALASAAQTEIVLGEPPNR